MHEWVNELKLFLAADAWCFRPQACTGQGQNPSLKPKLATDAEIVVGDNEWWRKYCTPFTVQLWVTLISKTSSFVETCLGLQEFGEGQFVGSRCCKQVLLYGSQTEFMDVHPMTVDMVMQVSLKRSLERKKRRDCKLRTAFLLDLSEFQLSWLPHAGPPLMSELFVQKLIHRSSSASSSLWKKAANCMGQLRSLLRSCSGVRRRSGSSTMRHSLNSFGNQELRTEAGSRTI